MFHFSLIFRQIPWTTVSEWFCCNYIEANTCLFLPNEVMFLRIFISLERPFKQISRIELELKHFESKMISWLRRLVSEWGHTTTTTTIATDKLSLFFFFSQQRLPVESSVTSCWNKKYPKFTKKYPRQFDLKSDGFTTAQKVTKHLGNFYNNICCQEIPKNRPIWSRWLQVSL